MSVKALNWAFEQPLAGNEKCVLLALADFAHDDGKCWPGQESVAAKAYVSVKTVSRILAKLEEGGYLYREKRFKPDGTRTSDLTVLLVPEHRPRADRPTTGQIDFRSSQADHRTPVSGEPSEEPSDPPGDVSARARTPVLKISGKPVNDAVWAKTRQALAEFNALTGRNLGATTSGGQPSESAKRIYARLAAWPDLSQEQIGAIIAATLRSKWWGDDTPDVGVVFGPRVFERNMERPGEAPPAPSKQAEKKERDARRLAAMQRVIEGGPAS